MGKQAQLMTDQEFEEWANQTGPQPEDVLPDRFTWTEKDMVIVKAADIPNEDGSTAWSAEAKALADKAKRKVQK